MLYFQSQSAQGVILQSDLMTLLLIGVETELDTLISPFGELFVEYCITL